MKKRKTLRKAYGMMFAIAFVIFALLIIRNFNITDIVLISLFALASYTAGVIAAHETVEEIMEKEDDE